MSSYNDIDITCSQCGTEFRGTIWTAVNARQDPELKDLLLGGELNMVMCPECTLVAYQDHFVLYQDPAAELVAYVYPEAQKTHADTLREAMLHGFHEAQAVYEEKDRLRYEPVLLFGLESLVEMMHEEESRAEQSQIAEALCRQEQIPYTLLPPAVARRRGLPRVLPGASSTSPNRDELLAGIERLLAINPSLTLYATLRDSLAADIQRTL
jgi:hypothetical protein